MLKKISVLFFVLSGSLMAHPQPDASGHSYCYSGVSVDYQDRKSRRGVYYYDYSSDSTTGGVFRVKHLKDRIYVVNLEHDSLIIPYISVNTCLNKIRDKLRYFLEDGVFRDEIINKNKYVSVGLSMDFYKNKLVSELRITCSVNTRKTNVIKIKGMYTMETKAGDFDIGYPLGNDREAYGASRVLNLNQFLTRVVDINHILSHTFLK